jgi:hypothetical protein
MISANHTTDSSLHFLENGTALSPCFAGFFNFCVFGFDPERAKIQGVGAGDLFSQAFLHPHFSESAELFLDEYFYSDLNSERHRSRS